MRSFEAIPATVFKGDDLDLVLTVQNKGEPEAKDVTAWLTSYSPLNSSDGIFPIIPDDSSDFKGPVELDPPTENSEGEINEFIWNLHTDGVTVSGSNSRTTVKCSARVFYSYNTSAKTTIPVLSNDEYKRLVSRDEELPSQDPVRVTRGPFTVNINSNTPIVVDEDSETFNIEITAKNTKSGTPYHPSVSPVDSSEDNPVGEKTGDIQMKILVGRGASLTGECSDYADQFADHSIRKSEDLRQTCDLRITDDSAPRRDIPLTVILSYGYFIEKETEVTVRGRS